MIQYQILQTDITRTVWQTVRRITDEILGVKGLNPTIFSRYCYDPLSTILACKKNSLLLFYLKYLDATSHFVRKKLREIFLFHVQHFQTKFVNKREYKQQKFKC